MSTTYDRMRAAARWIDDSCGEPSDIGNELRADADRLEAVEKWARDPYSAPTMAVLRHLADRIRGEAT